LHLRFRERTNNRLELIESLVEGVEPELDPFLSLRFFRRLKHQRVACSVESNPRLARGLTAAPRRQSQRRARARGRFHCDDEQQKRDSVEQGNGL